MSATRTSKGIVLVTGNLGYIGSVLVPVLRERGYTVRGYDNAYYGSDCSLGTESDQGTILASQSLKDVRAAEVADFEGVDAVVHLAALSNDPLGELEESATEEINLGGTLRVAEAARSAGVRRFVYASSQSMYGVSDTSSEVREDESEKNPITVYARTKWEAELGLGKLATKDFEVVAFRPSTVFGASPKLRCDIVYNNFVACAYTTGRIEVKSDGTPWRPVVHVRDVCGAFVAGIEAPSSLVAGRAFNVGIPNGNFTVRDLALAARDSVPGSELTFTGEHGSDSRTYRVSFERILTDLAGHYRPEWDLARGGRELVGLMDLCGFTEAMFRGRTCTRLEQIRHLMEAGLIDSHLRWADGGPPR